MWVEKMLVRASPILVGPTANEYDFVPGDVFVNLFDTVMVVLKAEKEATKQLLTVIYDGCKTSKIYVGSQTYIRFD